MRCGYTTIRQYCFFFISTHSLIRSVSLGSFYLKYVLYAIRSNAVYLSLRIKYFVLWNRREQLMNPEKMHSLLMTNAIR